MITVSVISKKRGYAPTRDHKLTWKEAAPVVKEAILPMCLPVIIIGGVRLGVFTATEAGAVAVAYSVLLGLSTGNWTGRRSRPACVRPCIPPRVLC